MTREEFIKGYCDRSKIAEADRRPWGFWIGNHKRYAVPCDCGEPSCDGWQMTYDPPEPTTPQKEQTA